MREYPISHFAAALDLQLARRGHNANSILNMLYGQGHGKDGRVILNWQIGKETPRHSQSFHVLSRIAQLFGLPTEYFSDALIYKKSSAQRAIQSVAASQQRAMRWHIPMDFDARSPCEQEEILKWLAENILPGATDFGKFQQKNSGTSFAIVFPGLQGLIQGRISRGLLVTADAAADRIGAFGTIAAPARLEQEVRGLVEFKTSLLAPMGYIRGGKWEKSTASYASRRIGEVLGTLAAAPFAPVGGLGIPLSKLTLGLLVFPAVWDWYFNRRKARRGFFTNSERSLAYQAKELSQDPTGWLRQNPNLVKRIEPIEGLVTAKDILAARNNWGAACDRMLHFAKARTKDLHAVALQHRDPFAAILPILESESPLLEYKKITDEIVRHMPDPLQKPLAYAIACRAYLMLRMAMHTGLRQRNLRELLICMPGDRPRSMRDLQSIRRGEMCWNVAESRWEVMIPACAFKNRTSSFFNGRPYILQLPNLQNFYDWIDHYIRIDRPLLLNGEKDRGTFLVRNTRRWGLGGEYDMFSFYAAWKFIVQIYGIYNPYTKRGVIKGLLPHGPHAVRDILATHILKKTQSVELAAFAIQDTPAAVQRHYGRFLPQDKIAKAAEVLNEVWQ